MTITGIESHGARFGARWKTTMSWPVTHSTSGYTGELSWLKDAFTDDPLEADQAPLVKDAFTKAVKQAGLPAEAPLPLTFVYNGDSPHTTLDWRILTGPDAIDKAHLLKADDPRAAEKLKQPPTGTIAIDHLDQLPSTAPKGFAADYNRFRFTFRALA